MASLGWHVDLLYETETQEVKKIADTLYVYSHWSLLLRTKYGVVWTEKLDPFAPAIPGPGGSGVSRSCPALAS